VAPDKEDRLHWLTCLLSAIPKTSAQQTGGRLGLAPGRTRKQRSRRRLLPRSQPRQRNQHTRTPHRNTPTPTQLLCQRRNTPTRLIRANPNRQRSPRDKHLGWGAGSR
jgi:hypothetical protein